MLQSSLTFQRMILGRMILPLDCYIAAMLDYLSRRYERYEIIVPSNDDKLVE